MRATVAAIFILLSCVSAQAVECKTHKGEGWWSWRLIDGKRCWFAGKRMDKSQLRWPRQHHDAAPPPGNLEPRRVRAYTVNPAAERKLQTCCWPPMEKK